MYLVEEKIQIVLSLQSKTENNQRYLDIHRKY